MEDDTYVICGPAPLQPLPSISLGKLIYDSLLVNIKKHEALVDAVSGESLSYREVLEKTCSLAKSLRRSGYGKNTVVSVCSENNIQFFIPVISCLYIGAITAPINPNYTERETIHTLNISKPRIIFCSKTVSRKYVEIKSTKFSFIERIIVIDTKDEIYGAETLDEFITKSLNGNPMFYRFQLAELDPRKQAAFIMCSSGTTGLPKGVMQSHTNFIVRYMHTIDPRFTKPAENILGFLPLYHGFGFVTNLNALIIGQKIIIMKRFQEDIFLKTIQGHRISTLWLPPPLVIFLAKSPLVDEYDLSCVEELISGAAPLSRNIEEAVKTRLNVQSIRQMWGLSEVTFAATMMHVGQRKHGSSGKVASYMSCKVRDPETGKSLGPGKVGELCLKGPMVMLGYYGNEEATKNTFTFNGWLLTGDLGYYDEDENFYIVDRVKELIKYNSFQVPPAELEAILLSNPKIKDAAVVGVPDEQCGELPLAFVVQNEGVNLTEEEVMHFVAAQVSSPKKLRGGVIFMSAIPKSASGKILRRELRKMLATHKAKL